MTTVVCHLTGSADEFEAARRDREQMPGRTGRVARAMRSVVPLVMENLRAEIDRGMTPEELAEVLVSLFCTVGATAVESLLIYLPEEVRTALYAKLVDGYARSVTVHKDLAARADGGRA
jgi:hypothetical protein